MKYYVEQMIDAGEMLPQFRLPAAGGRVVQLWDYKQHKQLILLALHAPECPDCRQLLKTFAAYYPAFREEETEILALFPAPLAAVEQAQQELHLPFPLLANEQGEVLRRFASWDEAGGPPQPTLLVADRFGALYARYTARTADKLPSPDLALRDLEYIAIQCPECGAAEWLSESQEETL